MKRRVFLKGTLTGMVAGAGMRLGTGHRQTVSAAVETGRDMNLPADGYRPPDWLRYIRPVYFDGYTAPLYPSIKHFHAKRLVDITLKLGGDTLRFQPIGYRAYFPSKAFPVFSELGNRDLINEVSQECRKAGLHLYCYTGYGMIIMDLDLIQQHPEFSDWVLRDIHGEPYGVETEYGVKYSYKICITGDAYRQAMRTTVRELCEHDTDGVYFDCPSNYRGVCFCDSCRTNFKKFSGMDLERLGNVLDVYSLPRDVDMAALVAWFEWANKLTKEDLLDFRKIIHCAGKFMLCHNGATWRGASLPLQYRIPEGFMVEYHDQTYQRLVGALMGASMARPARKLAMAYMGSYDVSTDDQPSHSKPWAVHMADIEDSDEIRMEGFANLAGGSIPIYACANRLYFGIGSGSAEAAQEVFRVVRRAEPILKDSVPVPYVGIVPTWEALQLWRTRRRSWNMMMTESLALVLLDSHISFDVNPNTEMTADWLQRQRVVALCGASALKDEDVRLLADWVSAGGGLLATYDSGLYTAHGEPRKDGGALKDLLDVEMKGEPPEGQADCFYRVKADHPALGEYGKSSVVMGDARLAPVEVRDGATLLADCWNLQMEQVRGPAIVAKTLGKGRTIYISGSLEAHYPSSRVASLQKMLVSIIRYLAGDAPVPFQMSAPRGVYGVLRESANGDLALWVLANVGFKDASIGRMRQDFLPVHDVEVRVLVPEGRQARSVELIRAKRSIPFKVDGKYAVASIPTVHIAELVHWKLA